MLTISLIKTFHFYVNYSDWKLEQKFLSECAIFETFYITTY